MKRKIKQLLVYFLILLVLMFSLVGCSNENDKDSEDLKEKIKTELSYLDTQLLDMLNKVNGISFKNYMVVAEKVNQTKSSESGGQSTGSQSSSGSQSSGSESSSSSGNSSNPGGESDKNYQNYKMEPNNILSNERTADWESLKKDVESLYSTWSTIMLDLYKKNINGEDILSFGTDLDSCIQAIKKEDKKATLTSLAKLYSYLPKYSTAIGEDAIKNNVLKTKSDVLNGYAMVEHASLEDVKKQIASAEQSYLPIINDMQANQDSQFNINKAYILIKDLQNSLDTKDLDVFYIKYKALIEELNIIES